jgi:hypothetical protein
VISTTVPRGLPGHTIDIPVERGEAVWRGFREPVDIRIDTGADITVVPYDLLPRFAKANGGTPPSAVDTFTYRVATSQYVLLDIFELDFDLPNLNKYFHTVPVIELDVPYVLLGIHRCLELCTVRCDYNAFPAPKSSL